MLLALSACSTTTSSDTSTYVGIQTSSDELPQPTLVTSTTGSDAVGSTEESASGSTSSTSTTGSPGTTGLIPDFAEGVDHCNGKIDFLFMINRGHGMTPWWNRFHAAFPGFVDEIFETFEGYDMHFMAIDGIGLWGVSDCKEPCLEAGVCEEVPGFPCERYINDEVKGCDSNIQGAGVIFPTGVGSANHDCGALEGRRFISSDQPDAIEAVKCIGQMGNTLPSEVPRGTSHMLQALTPHSPGWNCNGDFLRDDAMLAVVYYEDDDSVPCYPAPTGAWAETVYAAKGGDRDRVMFIGIINDKTSEAPTVCPGASGSYVLCAAEFLHFYITHRIEGSRCEEDYGPIFDAGLEMLRLLCDQDIPT